MSNTLCTTDRERQKSYTKGNYLIVSLSPPLLTTKWRNSAYSSKKKKKKQHSCSKKKQFKHNLLRKPVTKANKKANGT